MRIDRVLVGLVLGTGLVVGCKPPAPETIIEVKNVDPWAQVKATLVNYIKGKPVSSEVTTYDAMIDNIRKIDSAKADILKAGLDEIKKSKGSPVSKARELMKKLDLSDPSVK
jgi:hypothetical protein